MYLIGFAQGTGAHIRDLMHGGIHAYSSLPQAWIQVFFVSLVVLDPLVVLLGAFARREGIWLAAGVMVDPTTPAVTAPPTPAASSGCGCRHMCMCR